jgi:hypothetical protein
MSWIFCSIKSGSYTIGVKPLIIPPTTKFVVGRSILTIFHHIKSNNSGTEKVKIVKNETDPPLFTGKLLIKFGTISNVLVMVLTVILVKLVLNKYEIFGTGR